MRLESASSAFLQGIAAKAQLLRAGHQAGLARSQPGLQAAGLLFAGMGGSGAAALLVRDAAGRVLDKPFTITQNHGVPRHVKADWHVLAVSYSGETEETLAVAREAAARGCRVTAFSTGGTLAGVAQDNVAQPSGYAPRVALAHAWFSLLGFLEGSGLLPEPVPVKQAIAAVREVDDACGPDVPEAQNEAKQLARRLVKRIPQVYATPPFAAVGTFFAALLNENAKKIADVDEIPECNHNALTGFSGDENRRHFTILVLSSEDQDAEMARRIAFMRQRFTRWGVPWDQRGFGSTATFASHVVEQARALQLLDYVSYYTALLRGVDPAEIDAVTGLKRFLREGLPSDPLGADAAGRLVKGHGHDAGVPGARHDEARHGEDLDVVPVLLRGRRPPPQPRRRAPGAGNLPRSVATLVEVLTGHDPMTVADLRAASGLPRRTISAGLRILRARGDLRQRLSLRDSRQTYFWLDPAPASEHLGTLPATS